MTAFRLTALLAYLLGALPPILGQTTCSEAALRRVVSMEYPPVARSAFLQGKVEAKASISPEGDIKGIRLQTGSPLLFLAVKDLLSKWKFTGCSARVSQSEVAFVFSFVLDGTCRNGSRCPTDFEANLSTLDKLTTVTVTVTSKTIEGPTY